MSIISVEIVIFVAIFYAIYTAANSRLKPYILAYGSLAFYSIIENSFYLLFINLLINFGLGLGIDRYKRYKNVLLSTGVILNVAMIAWGKTMVSSQAGIPLGISFYSFQGLGYLIDLARNKTKPIKDINLFIAFQSFFPQLVAGPICHANELLPQIKQPETQNQSLLVEGFFTLAIGLFKKIVIADAIATRIDPIFAGAVTNHDQITWFIVICSYAVQIYFDFSGYTDMAIGLGKFFGINLPTNFNHPYFASSLTNFWHRWHITLSSWFRDNVYKILGGNRKGQTVQLFSITITMLLSALWHGVSQNFLLWGAWHAGALILDKFLYGHITWWKRLQRLYCLIAVFLGWIFFRASSTSQAMDIFSSLFRLTDSFNSFVINKDLILLITTSLLLEFGVYKFKGITSIKSKLILGCLIFSCAIILRSTPSEFIYFRF